MVTHISDRQLLYNNSNNSESKFNLRGTLDNTRTNKYKELDQSIDSLKSV